MRRGAKNSNNTNRSSSGGHLPTPNQIRNTGDRDWRSHFDYLLHVVRLLVRVCFRWVVVVVVRFRFLSSLLLLPQSQSEFKLKFRI
jgi:hypothetical protein